MRVQQDALAEIGIKFHETSLQRDERDASIGQMPPNAPGHGARAGRISVQADGVNLGGDVFSRFGDNRSRLKHFQNAGRGDGSVMQFGHGIYLRNVIPIEGGVLRMGEQEKYASDATLRSWAEPVPNATWSNTRSDGGSAKSGPVKKLRVGNCTYDGFTVTLGFADDPNYVEVYDYIPSLGIGLLTEILENGTTDRYRYTSISKQ